MSGIYIKGMDMPKSCDVCPFNVFKICLINTLQEGKYSVTHSCPLIPVPEHGDLIEREPLRASIKESIDECHKWAKEVNEGEMYARVSQSLGTFVECSLRIKAAPTIIPADQCG